MIDSSGGTYHCDGTYETPVVLNNFVISESDIRASFTAGPDSIETFIVKDCLSYVSFFVVIII